MNVAVSALQEQQRRTWTSARQPPVPLPWPSRDARRNHGGNDPSCGADGARRQPEGRSLGVHRQPVGWSTGNALKLPEPQDGPAARHPQFELSTAAACAATTEEGHRGPRSGARSLEELPNCCWMGSKTRFQTLKRLRTGMAGEHGRSRRFDRYHLWECSGALFRPPAKGGAPSSRRREAAAVVWSAGRWPRPDRRTWRRAAQAAAARPINIASCGAPCPGNGTTGWMVRCSGKGRRTSLPQAIAQTSPARLDSNARPGGTHVVQAPGVRHHQDGPGGVRTAPRSGSPTRHCWPGSTCCVVRTLRLRRAPARTEHPTASGCRRLKTRTCFVLEGCCQKMGMSWKESAGLARARRLIAPFHRP